MRSVTLCRFEFRKNSTVAAKWNKSRLHKVQLYQVIITWYIELLCLQWPEVVFSATEQVLQVYYRMVSFSPYCHLVFCLSRITPRTITSAWLPPAKLSTTLTKALLIMKESPCMAFHHYLCSVPYTEKCYLTYFVLLTVIRQWCLPSPTAINPASISYHMENAFPLWPSGRWSFHLCGN